MKKPVVLLFAFIALVTLSGLCFYMIAPPYGFRLTPTPTWTPIPTLMPTPTSTPKPTPTPTPTPFPVQASGWEKLTVHTLCLEVEQSYPEIEGKTPEPITETAQRILARIGVQVVPEGAPCDAILNFVLTGRALGADYIPSGRCYTGAEVTGQMTFAAPGREPLTKPVEGELLPARAVIGCPKEKREAWFGRAWSEALLAGLAHLWGPKLLMQTLGDKDLRVSLAAVEVLGEMGPESLSLLVQVLADERDSIRREAAEALGRMGPEAKEAVPALIQSLLGDKEFTVRERAAEALGRMGPEAKEAIPALIQALRDEEYMVQYYAAGALRAITGQGIGTDADRWEEWWKEQK